MKLSIIALLALTLFSCQDTTEKAETNAIEVNQKASEATFNTVLEKHLNAVSNKDLKALESTLSPNGEMQLILPKSEPTTSVEDFITYHREWFAAPIEWSFDTKVLNTKVGETLGMAVVEIIYKEPLRNGKPYFNRMIVTYDLEKIDNNWYFIKDQASSVEKSTD